MNPALLRRQAALAGVALLATVASLALSRRGEENGAPAAEPTPAGPWQEAVASTFGRNRYGRTTACGIELRNGTRGVAHPVLPCGVDVVIAYRGKEVRTEVIDRGPFEGGREFDLTRALAVELGFRGTRTIQWRFAG